MLANCRVRKGSGPTYKSSAPGDSVGQPSDFLVRPWDKGAEKSWTREETSTFGGPCGKIQ